MSLAEQKVAVMEFLVTADEEAMGKLVSFTQKLQGDDKQPSPEVIAMYEKRSGDFFASGEKGFSREESIQSLRKMIQ